MLISKTVVNRIEYKAFCESEEVAKSFLEYLQTEQSEVVQYAYLKGKEVYYLTEELVGVKIAKPFIERLASEVEVKNSKEEEIENSKEVESKNSKIEKIKKIETI